MIVITSIEYFETEEDVLYRIYIDSSPERPLVGVGGRLIERDILTEAIHGRVFIRPSDRQKIIIGCSNQAQEVIGIMYDDWATWKEAYEETRTAWQKAEREMITYRTRLHSLQSYSFWKRLKWAFTRTMEAKL